MQVEKIRNSTTERSAVQYNVEIRLRSGEVDEEDFALTLANKVKRAIEGLQ